MRYLVVEMQADEGGGVNSAVYTFDTQNEAESKYHSVLSFAAVGELPMHAATLLRSDGAALASAFYEHELPIETAEPGQDGQEGGGEDDGE